MGKGQRAVTQFIAVYYDTTLFGRFTDVLHAVPDVLKMKAL
jgi:hypothetical protein